MTAAIATICLIVAAILGLAAALIRSPEGASPRVDRAFGLWLAAIGGWLLLSALALELDLGGW